MGFLDNIQRAPSTGGSGGSSSYMKFEQGENKIRIIGTVDDGKFITGMIGWAKDKDGNRKPFRWKVDEKQPREFADKPKEFFAFLVFNYATNSVQVLEVTQRSIKDELINLGNDDEWGDWRKYDIAIVRNGVDLETQYAVTPKPHKKMTEEQVEIIKNTKADLSALYRGDHPIEQVEEEDAGEEEEYF